MQRQDLGKKRREVVCRVHLNRRSKEEVSNRDTGQSRVPPSRETFLSPMGNTASHFNPTECSPVQSPIVLAGTFFSYSHFFPIKASKK